MPTITGLRARDVRFSLGEGEGTDAVHDSSTYAYAVLELEAGGLTGCGMAFCLGAGTDLICRAALAIGSDLVGQDIEEVMADFGATAKAMANHPQWRWLGPEKGVVSLALAAITNACWDLWCKARGTPLWHLLLQLSPEELAATIDFSHLEDRLTRAEAVALLGAASAEERAAREAELGGRYPGYDTSFGWISHSDEAIREGAVRARAAGFRALKLKVGSADADRDVRRVRIVREAVGDGVGIAIDANQQWSLEQAKRLCAELAPEKLLWVEEPCHPDDVAAHAALREATGVVVAVGEAIPNRVLFKNFLFSGACQLAQLDPTRQAGVSECLAIALLARKAGVPVTHHVGDMGTIAQHMMPFYRVVLGQDSGVFLEHIPHLNAYFQHPVVVEEGAYVLPEDPAVGASTALLPTARLLEIGGCTVADVTLSHA